MARGGINQALVHKARQALLARGEHPSIDALRIELGNTGSKTTIHRYLKELEEADRGRPAAALPLSEQLASLITQVAEQLKADAQAEVAQEREQLARERGDLQHQVRQAESGLQQWEAQCAELTAQLATTQQALQQEQQLRQHAEVENARLSQAHHDQELRLHDRDGQIRSLEDKHQHAREALQHYRQASQEQREQEQRRHESQVQQLQLEVRQLQQTLIVKQDELTQLNRDNARLLAEARQLHREQYAQQELLTQKTLALEAVETAQATLEREHATVQQRCVVLQDDIAQLRETSAMQAQHIQDLHERLADATDQLKRLEHSATQDRAHCP